mmetsp:Transcript_19021/g.54021  ORF Transcript_19021/g.54021 Transcript_19021/m.54021 type:complete len:240 (+) Transcript_19021:1297-2016(+)
MDNRSSAMRPEMISRSFWYPSNSSRMFLMSSESVASTFALSELNSERCWSILSLPSAPTSATRMSDLVNSTSRRWLGVEAENPFSAAAADDKVENAMRATMDAFLAAVWFMSRTLTRASTDWEAPLPFVVVAAPFEARDLTILSMSSCNRWMLPLPPAMASFASSTATAIREERKVPSLTPKSSLGVVVTTNLRASLRQDSMDILTAATPSGVSPALSRMLKTRRDMAGKMDDSKVALS